MKEENLKRKLKQNKKKGKKEKTSLLFWDQLLLFFTMDVQMC